VMMNEILIDLNIAKQTFQSGVIGRH